MKLRQYFTGHVFLMRLIFAVLVNLLMISHLDLTQHMIWLIGLEVGLVLGLGFVQLDRRYFYSLYQQQTALKGLLSQSLIFIFSFIPLAVFIVTSSSSPIGIGFVLGFIITTAINLSVDSTHPERFQKHYLYQFARRFSPREQRLIVIAFVGSALLVGLLALV